MTLDKLKAPAIAAAAVLLISGASTVLASTPSAPGATATPAPVIVVDPTDPAGQPTATDPADQADKPGATDPADQADKPGATDPADQAESAEKGGAADADGPGGHADPDGVEVDHQFNGQE